MNNNHEHDLSAWSFELPQNSIAQFPVAPRDSARLLHMDRRSGAFEHRCVNELSQLLPPDAVLVMNNTRVVAARLVGHKSTGGKVEMLLSKPSLQGTLTGHEVLYRSNKKLRANTAIDITGGARAHVVEVLQGGKAIVDFSAVADLSTLLQTCGAVPLPPYIRGGRETTDGADKTSYQCVYAKHHGAVAAPTAGLHFTPSLLQQLHLAGVDCAYITLHVGPGTFLPVRATDIREHRVLAERFELNAQTASLLNEAKASGRPIIAVGTTTTRVLESCFEPTDGFKPGTGESSLTILPGHNFTAIDGLMTNFHLPRSSLLLLVGAFCGRQRLLASYREAIEGGYRFYSYGDAMLITQSTAC